MVDVIKIRNVKFPRKAIGGYNPEDVDRFLDEVLESFEAIELQNKNLQIEIAELNVKVERFREEELEIRRAIVNAQQIADASVVDAGVKSKYIIKEASERAARVLSDARRDFEKTLEVSRQLYNATEQFKCDLLKSYDKQIGLINSVTFEKFVEIDNNLLKNDEFAQKFCEKNDLFTFESRHTIFNEGNEAKFSGGTCEGEFVKA
ncbi:MAG: DivIVA domain-containing protein [Oscillospiraceae bacterium]|jgi:cell division initiation protein|nr:DivIVA domain-containing protein [Oscillospiraceae bacterium]